MKEKWKEKKRETKLNRTDLSKWIPWMGIVIEKLGSKGHVENLQDKLTKMFYLSKWNIMHKNCEHNNLMKEML